MSRPISLCILALVPACVAYEADPIDPAAVLAALSEEASASPRADLADLSALTEDLTHYNERVATARAAYRSRVQVAEAGVNWPALQLTAGPLLFRGAGIASSDELNVLGALGWALPLSGRRALAADLDTARADEAALRLSAVARSELLALRRDLIEASLAQERVALMDRLVAAVGETTELQRRLVAGGRGTALDRERAELLLVRTQGQLRSLRIAAAAARAQVSVRTGAMDPGAVDRRLLPPLPAEVPTLAALIAALPESPELLTLHAVHRTAEADLRLQVRRQYPDLQVGANFEREMGVDRIGIPLGFQIPLPFANRRGIASADVERTRARSAYALAARRRVVTCRGALERLVERAGQWEQTRAELGPALERLRAVTERSLGAGAVELDRVLQAERDRLQGVLFQLDVETALYRAWLDLEQAAGVPLLTFPQSPLPPVERADDNESGEVSR